MGAEVVKGRKWGEGDGDWERMKTSREEVGEGRKRDAWSLERWTSALAEAAAASKRAAERGGTALLRDGRGRRAEDTME